MSIDPSPGPATHGSADGPFVVPEHLRAEQLNDRMGIELLSWSRDEVVGRMPVAGNRQPYGLLHGGANAVLAETLGSVLAALNLPPDRSPVGLEISCTHHRGAGAGWVTGTARPVHVGRSTSTSEIVLVDDKGRRACTARLTCLHRDVHAPRTDSAQA
jgi:1,4-dihydroxy-2-naphthoyl-CoA hydrolase